MFGGRNPSSCTDVHLLPLSRAVAIHVLRFCRETRSLRHPKAVSIYNQMVTSQRFVSLQCWCRLLCAAELGVSLPRNSSCSGPSASPVFPPYHTCHSQLLGTHTGIPLLFIQQQLGSSLVWTQCYRGKTSMAASWNQLNLSAPKKLWSLLNGTTVFHVQASMSHHIFLHSGCFFVQQQQSLLDGKHGAWIPETRCPPTMALAYFVILNNTLQAPHWKEGQILLIKTCCVNPTGYTSYFTEAGLKSTSPDLYKASLPSPRTTLCTIYFCPISLEKQHSS